MAQISLATDHPWLVVLFFLDYRHFWWLKMEMQKSCPDLCLYESVKYMPGYNMA